MVVLESITPVTRRLRQGFKYWMWTRHGNMHLEYQHLKGKSKWVSLKARSIASYIVSSRPARTTELRLPKIVII